MKGLSPRNLRRMRIFYNEYKDIENWPISLANLQWSHNYTLIEKLPTEEEINLHFDLKEKNSD